MQSRKLDKATASPREKNLWSKKSKAVFPQLVNCGKTAFELDMKNPRAGRFFSLAQGFGWKMGQILKTHYPLIGE